MKAIDKLREEARARGRGGGEKFFLSSPLLLLFFDSSTSPLEIKFFFTCTNTLSVSTSKSFALQNTGALQAKKSLSFSFYFFS